MYILDKSVVATGFEGCEHLFPDEMRRSGSRGALNTHLSGKMDILDRLLCTLRFTTKDRIVLVSNYTQTLDLFAQLCRDKKYPYIRLDGSTSASKRQTLVDKFNDFTRVR